jgi:hemerythrin-like domain-containing protein
MSDATMNAPHVESGETFMRRLRSDHAGLSRVLREIDSHQAVLRSEPEYAQPLLEEAMRYLLQYQHAFHHPREDRLFARIRSHAPRLYGEMQRLVREHRVGQRRAEQLAAELHRATAAQLRGRRGTQLARLLHDYVRYTRTHMRREEAVFYARSESVLEPADWIALSASDTVSDPMSDLRRLAAEYPLLAARLTHPVREVGGIGIDTAGPARPGDLLRHLLEELSEVVGAIVHDAVELASANFDSVRGVRAPADLVRVAGSIHRRNVRFAGRCVGRPARWVSDAASRLAGAWRQGSATAAIEPERLVGKRRRR